jgi:glycosyltransferase involved in cell wall biosynthesis
VPETPDIRSISVVIPAKDEAENIGWVLGRMPEYVDEVIVVDGLSRDDTLGVARRIAPDVIVVHEQRPGKGAAVRAGLDAATGDCVVIIDADGSMDPQEIGAFAARMSDGADLVKGSRFMPGGGSTDITPLRAAGNRALLRVSNVLYGGAYSELCYGFMALRRSRIAELDLDADGFEIEAQIVARSIRTGLAVAEVPSQESARRYGQSKLRTFRDGWRVLGTLLREWRRPVGGRPAALSATIAIPIEPEEALLPTDSNVGA